MKDPEGTSAQPDRVPCPAITDMLSWPSPFRRRLHHYWLLVLCFCTGCVLIILLVEQWGTTSLLDAGAVHEDYAEKMSKPAAPTIAMVVASQRGDDTSWLDSFADWSKRIYVTDDPTANLTIPTNKGREGMVYLTYIIDNYDNLPDTIIFSHSKRFQWHNDDPLYDGQAVLQRLNFPYIRSEGYVNLRCVWTIGCPDEMQPLIEATAPADPHSEKARAGSFYKEAFEELFPNVTVPEQVAASCCAQFAATAEKVRERPRSDYQRFREWLIRTPLVDHLSGRILEYSWHIIFGKEPIFCPVASECYCKLFGLCGLQCESEDKCSAAYTLPPYSQLPERWPEWDWDDHWRNTTQIRQQFEEENLRGLDKTFAGLSMHDGA